MALLYKIDNSIFIEDLNSNQFDIALNGAFFKFDNQSQVYTIFNQFTGITVRIKVSDIPTYRDDLSIAYSEASLLAFLRLNTGASASGGASSLTLYGLSTNDYTNLEKSKLAGIESGAEVNNISDTDATDLTDGNDTTLHKHDNLYYTESEVDSFLSDKADLVGGVVPSSQLPSYVDDVLEFANLASFPVTGEIGKIYIDLATNFTYRWSGSIYVKLTDGGVNSFNSRTGIVTSQSGDYDASQITETGARVFVTPSEKTEITHSNRSILDLITESFTTTLKTAYDSTVTWISTNGANVLSHLSSTSNPHNVTKSQVGLSNVPNLDTSITANITDSTNKRFITDSEQTIIGNTSGVNTGDQDLSDLMVKSNNLSDLTDFDLARTNLGVASYTNGTAVLDFGVETTFTTLTVLNIIITNANLKGFSILNTETLETSLDDFAINGVTFEIQNIVDNTSFDIVAKASNLASGNYTVKWLLTI